MLESGVHVWRCADLAPTAQLFSHLRMSPEDVWILQDFHWHAPMMPFMPELEPLCLYDRFKIYGRRFLPACPHVTFYT